MKKMTILIPLLLITVNLFAPGDERPIIVSPVLINPYLKLWRATCIVESNLRHDAVGDKYLDNWSYGIAQIRQSRLNDFYAKTGIKYNVIDMLDSTKSYNVWIYYALQYPATDTERISREWNGGQNGMKKTSTIKYYLKIKKELLSL